MGEGRVMSEDSRAKNKRGTEKLSTARLRALMTKRASEFWKPLNRK